MPTQEVTKVEQLTDEKAHDYALVTFKLRDGSIKERKVYDHRLASVFLDGGPNRYNVEYDPKTHYMSSASLVDGSSFPPLKAPPRPEAPAASKDAPRSVPEPRIDAIGISIENQVVLKATAEICCALIAASKVYSAKAIFAELQGLLNPVTKTGVVEDVPF